jgi:hypothetical protein
MFQKIIVLTKHFLELYNKGLTDEKTSYSLQEGLQFVSLTDIIYQTWAGKTTESKKHIEDRKRRQIRLNIYR